MNRLAGVVWLGLALLGIACMVGHLACCKPQDAKSTAYAAELDACTLASKTLCASIACENKVRARYQRPNRPVPATCLVAPIVDAGGDQ